MNDEIKDKLVQFAQFVVNHPEYADALVIPPFLVLTRSRGQAARANFCLGVMPPRAIFGRS